MRQQFAINVIKGSILSGMLLLLLLSGTSRASAQSNYPTGHVVFSNEGLNLYTTGILAPYVHPQDSFLLVSGNNSGEIDTDLVNSWAATLKAQYPDVDLYAATSGLDNINLGSPGLDTSLIAGLMMVYEPNQQNAPEFTWDMDETVNIWSQAANTMRSHSLEAWGKPSGRALAGRDMAGVWDYGVLANIMDGMNVQTQGSCKNNAFQVAMDDLVAQYLAAGATSTLFVQVTVASNQTNGVSPEAGIACSKIAWAKTEISSVTVWLGTNVAEEAEKYLQLREALLQGGQPSESDMYVWDIAFESRQRGKGGAKHDESISVTIHWDSDADGIAEGADAPVREVTVMLELRDSSGDLVASRTGTTNGEGIFRTNFVNNLPDDTYVAEVTVVSKAEVNWNTNLDPTGNDTDVDGDDLPDQGHTIPH